MPVPVAPHRRILVAGTGRGSLVTNQTFTINWIAL